MKTNALYITVGLLLAYGISEVVSERLKTCEDSFTEVLADVCSNLHKQVEDALIADAGNAYRLRRAFFYAPNANPVLIKVIYNVTFAENITEGAQLQPNYCSDDANADNTITMLNSANITQGWTSSGVYTVFHPLTVHFMQLQLPFVLMRLMLGIFELIDPGESGPKAQTLLWDGSYDLPTLYINLHFTELVCIPTNVLFESVLSDFSSLLRIYAGQRATGVIQDSANTEFVGFPLPAIAVTPTGVGDGYRIPYYLLYVMSTIVIYIICISAIFFVASKTNHMGVKAFTRKNPEILKGSAIVVVAFIVLEMISRFATTVTLLISIKDPLTTFTVTLATFLFYCPGLFSLFKVGRKIHLYRHGRYEKIQSMYGHNIKVNTFIKCFVWISAYFAYIIVYAFFPAFILAFAYPIRVVTIFSLGLTFMFFSVIYLTTYLKKGTTLKLYFEKRLKSKHNSNSEHQDAKGKKGFKHTVLYGTIWFVIALTMLYFFMFIFALLYSLVIGRASVASSAPLAILSLLPSILISALAWIMKSTLLAESDNTNTIKGDGNENENEDVESTAEGNDTTEAKKFSATYHAYQNQVSLNPGDMEKGVAPATLKQDLLLQNPIESELDIDEKPRKDCELLSKPCDRQLCLSKVCCV